MHFQTSQSARAKSTIHLCGIYIADPSRIEQVTNELMVYVTHSVETGHVWVYKLKWNKFYFV